MNNSIARLFRNRIPAVLVLVTLLSVAGTTAPVPAVAAAPDEPRTESVLMRRSGGLTGMVEHFTVDRTTANRYAAEVLTTTASRRFRVLRSAYLPADPCCDRFTYTVVVRYSDNTVKTVTTVENTAGTPQVLLDVIQSTLLAGRTERRAQPA
ncbi:hypothetical protein FHR83_005894 [Actinoplanes campanulatus]|uniref:Secreted protein n=1 Tax=Actinoplanes campanulatus TaxID=113559 RepID=A0A7W5FH41_9ACTN|nr:hypothetical protein [Actinoplanes campanulatus]MBB3098199.1 hypothetical protein [Actinoplanes campanulatus]